MASFTEQLDLANSSRRIIDPQNNKGPTFLGALSDFASQVVGRGSNLLAEREANNARRTAAADQARTQDAQNAAADFVLSARRGEFDTRVNPDYSPVEDIVDLPDTDPDRDWTQPPPIDSELEGAPLPPDVTRVVGEVVRANRAEQQGRAPAGTGRIRLEAALEDLRARFPDRQFEIYKILKDAGIDHYLFRQAEIDEAMFDTEIKQRQEERMINFKAAVEAGLPTAIMDPAQAEEAGRQILESKYAAEQMARKREEERAQWAFDRDREAARQATEERQSTNLYMTRLGAMLNPVVDALVKRIDASGYHNSVGEIQDIMTLQTHIIPNASRVFDGLIHEAESNGFSAAANALRAEKERRIKDLQELFSGDASAFEVRKRFLEAMKTEGGLDAMEAFPVYQFLTQAFGQGFINSEFTSVRELIGDEAFKNLKKEMSGFDGLIDTPEERMTVYRLRRAMADEGEFMRLPEAQAREVIKTAASAHLSNSELIAQDPSNPSVEPYKDSGFRLTDAALALQPGMSPEVFRANIPNATGALFGGKTLAADKALIRANEMDGSALILGKRAAAQNILLVGRGSAISQHLADRGWKVEHTTVRGVPAFRPTLDRAAYERWSRQQTSAAIAAAGATGGVVSAQLASRERGAPTFEQALANVPEELRLRSGSLNLAMNYLMGTNEYDEAVKDIAPNDLRDFFATGVLPQSMIDKRTEATQQQQQTGVLDDEIVDAFRKAGDEAQAGGTQAYSNRVVTERQRAAKDQVRPLAEAAGVSWTLVDRLVAKESNWDINAVNASTKAAGLFQINDNKERTVTENIRDGLELLKEAQTQAQRSLSRTPTDAETYVFYQQGTGGARALTNPANSSRNAIDVLTEVYERIYPGRGREVATQAVTKNHGTSEMTAAQFVRAIMNYFNS